MFEEYHGCLRLEHSQQAGGKVGKVAGAKLCSFVRTLIFSLMRKVTKGFCLFIYLFLFFIF